MSFKDTLKNLGKAFGDGIENIVDSVRETGRAVRAGYDESKQEHKDEKQRKEELEAIKKEQDLATQRKHELEVELEKIKLNKLNDDCKILADELVTYAVVKDEVSDSKLTENSVSTDESGSEVTIEQSDIAANLEQQNSVAAEISDAVEPLGQND